MHYSTVSSESYFDYFKSLGTVPLAELSVSEASDGMDFIGHIYQSNLATFNTEPRSGLNLSSSILRRQFRLGYDIEEHEKEGIKIYYIKSTARAALADATYSAYSTAIEIVKQGNWMKIIYNENCPIDKPNVFDQLRLNGFSSFKPAYDVTHYSNYSMAYCSLGDLLDFVNKTQCWVLCIRNWLCYFAVHEGVYSDPDPIFECPNPINDPIFKEPSTQTSSYTSSWVKVPSPVYSPVLPTYSPEPGKITEHLTIEPTPANLSNADRVKAWLTGVPAKVPDFDAAFSEINTTGTLAGVPLSEFFNQPPEVPAPPPSRLSTPIFQYEDWQIEGAKLINKTLAQSEDFTPVEPQEWIIEEEDEPLPQHASSPTSSESWQHIFSEDCCESPQALSDSSGDLIYTGMDAQGNIYDSVAFLHHMWLCHKDHSMYGLNSFLHLVKSGYEDLYRTLLCNLAEICTDLQYSSMEDYQDVIGHFKHM
ncbi:hypothetical protein RhiJN_01598 [Ceratobasidium sp. AG-Ba]|nr:hypothetical protein RhiJN_01598 [Ceratobasidium sp. AG-Ba]